MSTQLLSTIRSSLQSFKRFSARLSISGTRRPRRLSFRVLRKDPQHDLMFCSGTCTEATCFDQLCKACVAEYFDYQKEKHEAESVF